jgi:hypothetical protein
MDFERLENAWRSDANTPPPQLENDLMEQLVRTLKARRRGEFLFAAIPLAAMTVFTAIAARSILVGQTALDREWAALAMLGVCWAMLIAVIALSLRTRRRGMDDGSPLRETLEALLAANRRARGGVRIFWISLPVFIIAMLAGVDQLHDVGKASGRDAWQMLLVFGVALGASLAWNTLRFFKVLKPEQRRLEGVLAEYRA